MTDDELERERADLLAEIGASPPDALAYREHLLVVAHELLGHALTGRSLGWPIRTIVVTPGVHSRGWTEYRPRAGLLAGPQDRVWAGAMDCQLDCGLTCRVSRS